MNRDPGPSTDFLKSLLRCFSESYLNGRFPRTWATYCRDDELIVHEETTVPILRPVDGKAETGATLFPVERGGHGFTDTEALETVFEAVKEEIVTGYPG